LQSVDLPDLPQSQDWYSSVAEFGMLRNDICGCCVIAGIGHMTQQESIYAEVPAALMTDEEAESQYATLSGYNPMDPSTDVGLYEGDAGRHWMTLGFTVGGSLDKIVGFADCDVRELDEVKYSVLLTGNAMLGIMLPRAAEERLDLWDVPTNRDDAELIGAHCVPVMGWDKDHWYVVSWGQLVPCTNAFIAKYLLEAHVTLTHRWMNAKGTTPAGFEWDYLVAASRQFSTSST
jgi:hypothetical protein